MFLIVSAVADLINASKACFLKAALCKGSASALRQRFPFGIQMGNELPIFKLYRKIERLDPTARWLKDGDGEK